MPSRRRSSLGRITRAAKAARQRRLKLTAEERLEYNERLRIAAHERIANETPDERDKRLKYDRKRTKERREALAAKKRLDERRILIQNIIERNALEDSDIENTSKKSPRKRKTQKVQTSKKNKPKIKVSESIFAEAIVKIKSEPTDFLEISMETSEEMPD